MEKKLQMMAYTPKKTTIKLYYVGFPAHWKEKLARLAVAVKPDYDFEKTFLPLCSVLRAICVNWVHGLVEIAPMRKGSDDTRWIVCLHPIDEKMCKEICVNLRAAACSYYPKKCKTEAAKNAFDAFCYAINEKELLPLIGSEEAELIDGSGRIASRYAYNGFCLKLKEQLCLRPIDYVGQPLQLFPSGQGELMSQILSDAKGDLYAYVFQMSLQTIPPSGKPMLLLHVSRRSFKNTAERSKTIFRNNMTVFVRHRGEKEYHRLIITGNGKAWKEADKSCYDSICNSDLPEATELMQHLEEYNRESCDPRILCTISAVNSFRGGRSESHIGKGVSSLDRQLFYREFHNILQDSIDMIAPLDKIRPTSEKLSLQEPCAGLREVVLAAGYRGIKIEVCSYDVDRPLAGLIKGELDDLLLREGGDNFSIETQWVPLGSYADPMPSAEYTQANKRKERICAIAERIEHAKNGIMTGSIVILPKAKKSGGKDEADLRDVKHLLRCGFALAGKVTQFILPDGTPEWEVVTEDADDEGKSLTVKIENTIYDLLRQFGYSSRLKKQPKKMRPCPVVAIGAFSQFHPIAQEKIRALPVVVTYDVVGGSIKVQCPVIEQGSSIPYYEACLKLVKRSLEPDFERACTSALKRFAEMKLKALENYYREKDAIVLVSGDGFVRSDLWPGISNKRIEGYSFGGHGVDKLDIGSSKESKMFDFGRSKLRIVRIRANEEVPDYYQDDGSSLNAGKGYYLYDSVYYASVPTDNFDWRYKIGAKYYSLNKPGEDFLTKKLVEYFPLRLCEGDDAFEVVNYLNELRRCSVQYKGSTNLPLPLHYIQTLQEYVDFD